MPAKSKTKRTLLQKAVAATETAKTWPAIVVGAVSEAAALAVSIALLNTAQEVAIVAFTTAGVAAVGWVSHAVHTGRISPPALQTYIGALVAQGGGLAVAFGAINPTSETNIVAISVAVLAAVGQVMQAVKSTKAPA